MFAAFVNIKEIYSAQYFQLVGGEKVILTWKSNYIQFLNNIYLRLRIFRIISF